MKRFLKDLIIVFTVLLCAIIHVSAASADYTLKITPSKSIASVGETVLVTLYIDDNNADDFEVYTMQDYICFDNQMIEIVEGSLTCTSGYLATNQGNRIYINRYSLSGAAASGEQTLLSFKAKLLKPGEIKFTHSLPEIASSDLTLYTVDLINASVTVVEPVYGDADGDYKLTSEDLVYLSRHIAKWSGYLDIKSELADLNGDGAVNLIDEAILARHLAGWVGYGTLPIA